jgi:uncharacterized protein DUF4336
MAPTDVTYPPLDTLKPVAEGLWVVDSGPIRVLGLPVPVRMTVIRLASGEAWLHSPTRFSPALQAEIERVGRIGHLVAPNVAHWMFLRDWQTSCPNAVVSAAPGLRERSQVKASGLRIDRELGDTAPPDWAGEIETVVVPGGLGFREVAFLHAPTRTLVLTDLVVNLEPGKLSLPARAFARLVGASAPDGRAPAYLRMAVRLRRREAAAAAERLLAFAPERVIFSHGRWFERDGAASLRRSLRWLLP